MTGPLGLERRFLSDYIRTPTNLVLLALIPFTFVIVAAGPLADAARLLGGGSLDPGAPGVETVTAGWAAGFLTGIAMYFQVSASRATDRRLVLAGLPTLRLARARLLSGAVLAVAASTAALTALAARQGLGDPLRVAAGTLMFALVYLAIGAVVGALVPTPVNGTVVILFVWIFDVFFGPTLSGSSSPALRVLPTHFVSLWTVDRPPGHGGPGELAGSLAWVVLALAVAVVVVAVRRPRTSRRRRPVRRTTQLGTGLRMGLADWRRTPVLWVLLALVPATFVLLSAAITPSGHTHVEIIEKGVRTVATFDPAAIHAGIMAPDGIASLAALVGIFVILDARAADRRLALAGQRPVAVVLTRLTLVLVASSLATVVSLGVSATVFDAANWTVYALGNFLAAVTYGLVGMLVGPVFGRVSGVFLAFLIPFLDLGIGQSPMLSRQPADWAQWLPGHGSMRILMDGALTPSFDTAQPLLLALAWVIGLALAVTAVLRSGLPAASRPTGAGPLRTGSRLRALTAPVSHGAAQGAPARERSR